MITSNKCTILVDWAYAFDYLSILEVKEHRLGKHLSIIVEYTEHLLTQMDEEMFNQIIASKEYENLYRANAAVFDSVELARYGQIAAKQVDDLNLKRQAAKIALQKRFWHNNLTEVKS